MTPTASTLPPDTVLHPSAPAAADPAHLALGWNGTMSALLVLMIGAAIGWMLWRRVRGAAVPGAGGQRLSIAETRSLGNRQHLVVAAYGERRFLLGVCPGRIDLLAPLDERPKEPPAA